MPRDCGGQKEDKETDNKIKSHTLFNVIVSDCFSFDVRYFLCLNA